jgi:UDP-N-acetylmuramate dehydrogenase
MNRIFLNKSHIEGLKNIVPDGIEQNVNLSKISRWKIGGKADCVVSPSSSEEVSSVVQYLFKHDLRYVVIGSTSNLLFSDKGLRAVCLKIGNLMSDFNINDETVWAQAGVWVPGFVRNVGRAGLSGIEHAVGIPGTLGGLICMNGGSQRKGIGSHIKRAIAVSPKGEIMIFTQPECEFEYRTSVFQRNRCIITELELCFEHKKPCNEIRDEMLEILMSRKNKFPQKLPNCGSTFISNPKIYGKYGPPGKIIEDLGFKGYRVGDAEVSNVHANFINNRGKATSNEVLKLIKIIREKVYDYTGFDMKSEVKYVSEFGLVRPAHSIK